MEYLDLAERSLEELVDEIYRQLDISSDQQSAIRSFLGPIKIKDPFTYEHCLRVGILSRNIGNFVHFDERAMFYAGILHDVGKALTRSSTLKQTEGWTSEDAEEIKNHVIDGHRMLRNYFDFSAEIILWHHRFQQDGYPETMPEPLHGYSEGTKVMIPMYGRMLALADVFDALHRVNSKFGNLTGEEIKEKMFKFNPDQKKLLDHLYQYGIMTTNVF